MAQSNLKRDRLRAAIAAHNAAVVNVERRREAVARAQLLVAAAVEEVRRHEQIRAAAAAQAAAALAERLRTGDVKVVDSAGLGGTIVAKAEAEGRYATALAAHEKLVGEAEAAEHAAARAREAVRAAAVAVAVSMAKTIAEELAHIETRRAELRAELSAASNVWCHEEPGKHLPLPQHVTNLLQGPAYVSNELPDSHPESRQHRAGERWSGFLPRLMADADASLNPPAAVVRIAAAQ